MTTTQYLAAQLTPLLAKLEAIKGDDKAAAAKRKPIQKQIDKLDAMKREQRKFVGEK